jgi:hypothetical protein
MPQLAFPRRIFNHPVLPSFFQNSQKNTSSDDIQSTRPSRRAFPKRPGLARTATLFLSRKPASQAIGPNDNLSGLTSV